MAGGAIPSSQNDQVRADSSDSSAGYLFDKLDRNDGLFQYVVYIPGIKTMSRITTRHDMDEYSHRKYKIFVFTDEDSLKRKIRLHMLENETEKE